MSLPDLLREIGACRICAAAAKPLPHTPRPVLQVGPEARVLIAGQAPGVRVHASGRPFTDPSGDRFRTWLGVDEATFYDPRCFAILPMGFCFPGLDSAGGDLPPRPECAPAWRARLMAGMPRIDLVICLGAHAMRWHMGKAFEGSVDGAVRNWRAGLDLRPAVIALPHPSWRNSGWLKRNPWFGEELLPALRGLIAE
ncbi:MAG: uracil-DNA glycosylase family protein, partial [Aestuariivirga sp.]|nr:uracil-DNA glycosylase family protein [Aestuariivirga sp.]